jgi:plasmid rolling circle replication initiator protein Rep
MDKLYLQTRFFGALLIKLVNDNINDYNGHMSTILFSYQTTYTVKTCHTPF